MFVRASLKSSFLGILGYLYEALRLPYDGRVDVWLSSSSPTSQRPAGAPHLQTADSVLLRNIIIPAPWLCSRRHLTNKSIVSRVQTELESYPATLFNILADSPNWFTEAMTCRVRYIFGKDGRSPEKVRRGNRDRTAISSTTTATQPSSASNAGNIKQLVIHIS